MKKLKYIFLIIICCFCWDVHADNYKVITNATQKLSYGIYNNENWEFSGNENQHKYVFTDGNGNVVMAAHCIDPGVSAPGNQFLQPFWTFSASISSNENGKIGAGYATIAKNCTSASCEDYYKTNIAIRTFVNGFLEKEYNTKDRKNPNTYAAYIGDYYVWLHTDDELRNIVICGERSSTKNCNLSEDQKKELSNELYKNVLTDYINKTGFTTIYSHDPNDQKVKDSLEIFKAGVKAYYDYDSKKVPFVRVSKGNTTKIEGTDFFNTEINVRFQAFSGSHSIFKVLRVSGGTLVQNLNPNLYNDETSLKLTIKHKSGENITIKYAYDDDLLYSGQMYKPEVNTNSVQRFIIFSGPIENEFSFSSDVIKQSECNPGGMQDKCTDGQTVDSNGKITSLYREGYDSNSFNLKKCIIGESNETLTDTKGNPFKHSINTYCSYYCREEVEIKQPYQFNNIIPGTKIPYDEFKVSIKGRKTCYEVIDNEKYNKDLSTKDTEISNYKRLYNVANDVNNDDYIDVINAEKDEITSQYSECLGWINSGSVTDKFDPTVSYTYDEITSKRVPNSAEKKCNGKPCNTLISNRTKTTADTKTAYIYSENTCNGKNVSLQDCVYNRNGTIKTGSTSGVSSASYAVIDLVYNEAVYTLPRVYYISHNNIIRVFNLNDKPDTTKYDVVDGLPVPVSTSIGKYNYKLSYSNLGSGIKPNGFALNDKNEYACTYGMVPGDNGKYCRRVNYNDYEICEPNGDTEKCTSGDYNYVRSRMNKDKDIKNLTCCPECKPYPECPTCSVSIEPIPNITYRSISSLTINPNNRDMGQNWKVNDPNVDKRISQKAEKTIAEIQTNNTLKSHDYTLEVTMTPAMATFIRNYNSKVNAEKLGSYNNDTLLCSDYVMNYNQEECANNKYTWQDNKCVIQNVVCYSSFIDDLIEKYPDSFESKGRKAESDDNRYLLSNFTKVEGNDGAVTDGYWTIYPAYVSRNVGPAWK